MTTAKKAAGAKPVGSFTSPYDMFSTDKSKEQDGIELNYSDVFWIKITRAGGSNEHYKNVLLEKTKPFRRAIQTETMSTDAQERILREAVAEGVVLGWRSKQYGPGKIPGKDGQPIDFTVANVVALFEDLPDLFQDVYEHATKFSLFRATVAEADAGN